MNFYIFLYLFNLCNSFILKNYLNHQHLNYKISGIQIDSDYYYVDNNYYYVNSYYYVDNNYYYVVS